MATKLRTTETALVRQILSYLSMYPNEIQAWRANTGVAKYTNKKGETRYVKFGTNGMPDIQGFIKGGRFLGIEVKVPGQKLSPDQEEFFDTGTFMNTLMIKAWGLNDVTSVIDPIIKELRTQPFRCATEVTSVADGLISQQKPIKDSCNRTN
jgi:hypothetical protein